MTNLLTYLREKLRLTGAKKGCNEGGCCSCTVMISKYDNITEKISHFAVSTCLAPIGTLHGLAVTTVEGLGSTKTRLHPVQERIAKAHGSQCGFCTPGFVMSMYTLLRNNPEPSMNEIEENLVDSQREVLFDDQFLENELKIISNSNEVLVTIKVPLTMENEFFRFYKQSRRKGKDLAIVNAAIKISFDFPSQKINDIIIALGSIKQTTMLATNTMKIPEDQEKIDPVGRPIPHVSALKQTTGEATYVDDIPSFENELHAALVLSQKANARIVSIDPSEALKNGRR
ncbi:hypothetical protein Avbf_16263 [Armadillidium vulgare]|nr:hypothetical protein Avbf_16263 [Armadillidium vulgare]